MTDKRALIITAHGDDETLGMGGTICKLREQGWEVCLLVMAVNLRAALARELGYTSPRVYRASKDRSIRAAGRILGIDRVRTFRHCATELGKMQLKALLDEVKREVDRFRPRRVYTHFAGDLNEDHQWINRAVLTAIRPKTGWKVRELLVFEVPNSTGWNDATVTAAFVPQHFELLTEKHLRKKEEAFACYPGEPEAYPSFHSDAGIRAHAAFRGMSVGEPYAETFMILRTING